MDEREIVKIKSDNPAHLQGYYQGFKDQMGPDDVEYIEAQIGERPDNSGEGQQIDAGTPCAEPIKNKKKVRK